MTTTYDSKPPDGSTFPQSARIAELEQQLAQARADTIAAVKKHEDWVLRASEVLGDAADSHDLCGTYDEYASDAGLLPRMRSQDVEIEVTYRQTVTIQDRTWERACEQVKGLNVSRFFAPGSPFQEGIEESGSPYSVAISVIDGS